MSASSSCEEWTTVPEHFDVESEDENQHLDEDMVSEDETQYYVEDIASDDDLPDLEDASYPEAPEPADSPFPGLALLLNTFRDLLERIENLLRFLSGAALFLVPLALLAFIRLVADFQAGPFFKLASVPKTNATVSTLWVTVTVATPTMTWILPARPTKSFTVTKTSVETVTVTAFPSPLASNGVHGAKRVQDALSKLERLGEAVLTVGYSRESAKSPGDPHSAAAHSNTQALQACLSSAQDTASSMFSTSALTASAPASKKTGHTSNTKKAPRWSSEASWNAGTVEIFASIWADAITAASSAVFEYTSAVLPDCSSASLLLLPMLTEKADDAALSQQVFTDGFEICVHADRALECVGRGVARAVAAAAVRRKD
ncbi:hypothetical protein BU26DRAFT_559837 [Trematosphaeria pertusa]|uniref:Uncharacterized protein n=1 Tax=Trematosphaeria pertusa TaxID=390896 RepID=A0A6A6IXE7_9PLEO|nr:uncharacterized protein BU26DRAFT_559837 [Trematosphaeria pertusa]KAF2255225.1 hypothetical protein BU26DRAFT_559837 [Trematosphaeria pertusa]